MNGTPLALTLSATGDCVAWLTEAGASWIATSGDDLQRIPATAGYGGVTFVDGHLLCAPSRAAGDVLVVSTRSEDRRSISLGRLDLDRLAAALRDHGLREPAEMTALWIAITAGLPDAREVVFGSRSSRGRILGTNPATSITDLKALLVHLPGGRLVRIRRRDGAWHRTDIRPPRPWRLAEGRDACLHPDGRHVAVLLDDADGRQGRRRRPRRRRRRNWRGSTFSPPGARGHPAARWCSVPTAAWRWSASRAG